jgi:integrase
LDEIEPSDIGDFMGNLASKGLAPKTKKNIYQLLDLMLSLARENGFMKFNPIRPRIHRPKVVRKEKQTFSTEQVRAIYTLAAPIYRAPIATLLMTGIRAGELLGLQWKDIDFLNKRITIDGSVWRGKLKSTKTGSSVGDIGMPDLLAEILHEHRRSSNFISPDDFVFCQADGRPWV